MVRIQASGLLGALMALGVAATACSPQAAPATPPPAAQAPAAQASAVPAQAAGGAELRLPTTEPPNMDPGKTSDSQSVKVLMQLFEGLTAQDPQGNIQPKLAESWEVSADGLTYTFHLRQGPKWSDGKPVTARDFEWAWKRNIDPKTASDYATSLFPIKNAEKINKGELDKEQLGVQAKDDRTLVVTLEQPAAYFLVLASTWTLMPLRQDVVEKFGDQWVEAANMVSEGPYKMTEWSHDQQIVLQADPNYWGAQPSIRRVVFKVFPENGEEQALNAYEAGELDTLGTSLGIPTSQVDRVKADPSLGYMTYDESSTDFLTVNTRQEYLQDPRVRKALGMTIEREKVIRDVLKLPGTPAYSVEPPGIAGRNPAVWPKEDPAVAQQLLADAGHPGGKGLPELHYAYNTNSVHQLVGQYLQQRWAEMLGVHLTLSPMEFKAFLDWKRGDGWVKQGDIVRSGWFSDYEDPYDWFNLLWDSQSDPQQNSTGWKNDRYDDLVRRAAAETDPARRAALYGEAEQILAEDYPIIPIYHYGGQTLVRPYVHGLQPVRATGVLPLATMTLDPH